MKTIVCKEGGNLSRSMDTIILGKFLHCKEIDPILLLVAHGTPKVLFEDLVDAPFVHQFEDGMLRTS